MCKFCEENFKIETNIGDRALAVFLYEDDKRILNVRLPFAGGGGVTKPIKINYCPFCGSDLDESNCHNCYNYNIGDGVDDIEKCVGCKYTNIQYK